MAYIYRFLNNSNEIIYIGFAKSLTSRIDRQHLQNAGGHLLEKCYLEINTIEYLEFKNDSEAMLYEELLIYKYLPKYNSKINKNLNLNFLKNIKENWKFYCKVLNKKIITKTDNKIANPKRQIIGSAIDTELYNKLKELSEQTRIPISKLLDEALELLLVKHKS